MSAFLASLSEYTERDPRGKMSKLDYLKVDLLYLHELQNVFCEYLQHFAQILLRKGSVDSDCQLIDQDGGPQGP